MKFKDKEGTELVDGGSYNISGNAIGGPVWTNNPVGCMCSNWKESNYDVTIETFLDASDRGYLFDNLIPGAIKQVYTILGQPHFADLSYSSGNSIIASPIIGSNLADMYSEKVIICKHLTDVPINTKLFHIKLDGVRI